MGNNLSYKTHDMAEVAARAEEVVRKDIGADKPVPYRLDDAGLGGASVGSYLTDVRHLIGSGRSTERGTIEFELPGPREATLELLFVRIGLLSQCSSIVLVTRLRGGVDQQVGLKSNGWLRAPEFEPGASATRLNAVKGLSKRVEKIARTEMLFGTITLRQERLFGIYPEAEGSALAIATLPRPTGIGSNATTDAKELLGVADAIDAALLA